jgi:hypothetical protein
VGHRLEKGLVLCQSQKSSMKIAGRIEKFFLAATNMFPNSLTLPVKKQNCSPEGEGNCLLKKSRNEIYV